MKKYKQVVNKNDLGITKRAIHGFGGRLQGIGITTQGIEITTQVLK